jgi:hypothetical protein
MHAPMVPPSGTINGHRKSSDGRGRRGRYLRVVPQLLRVTKKDLEFAFKGIAAIATVFGLLIGAAHYIFHIDLFEDATARISSRYDKLVLPHVELAQQFVTQHSVELQSEGRPALERLIAGFVAERKILPGLQLATEALEEAIRCNRSWTCHVQGYRSYEQAIRRFWYTYRPVLLPMRGTQMPADFGRLVEVEAARILQDDRRLGRLP